MANLYEITRLDGKRSMVDWDNVAEFEVNGRDIGAVVDSGGGAVRLAIDLEAMAEIEVDGSLEQELANQLAEWSREVAKLDEDYRAGLL